MYKLAIKLLAKRTIYVIRHKHITIRLAKLGSGDRRLDVRLWCYALYVTWEGLHCYNRHFFIKVGDKKIHLKALLRLWPITILLERVFPREWKEMST